MRAAAIVSALLVLLSAAVVHAHSRSVSYSSWSLSPDGATVTCRVSLLDLTALEAEGLGERRFLLGVRASAEPVQSDPVFLHLQERLRLRDSESDCAPVLDSGQRLVSNEGYVSFEWRIACEAEGTRRIRSDLLFDVVPGHLHFARVRQPATGRDAEWILDEAEREIEIRSTADESASSLAGTIVSYVALGFEHILGGWDHLVFLLVLVLAAISLGDLVRVVTGFTVGHSITLAMAVLGYATPAANAVEALIGLSIALVAVENIWLSEGRQRAVLPAITVGLLVVGAALSELWGGIGGLALIGLAIFSACHFTLLRGAERPERWRWTVASLFGLIHGFAFAGVLTEMSLPQERLAVGLLGFNVGVELGQLAVVLMIWPALLLWRRRGEEAQLALAQWGSAAALCAGVFWFVSRAF